MFAYPYFARHKNDREWVSKVYRQITLGMSFVNMVIVLCGVLFAEPIISLFFGRIYLDSVEPFRILMVSYFISGTFHTIAGNLLVTQRKLKFNLFAGILGALFSMVLNVLLIPELHSVGAAMTQLITNAMLGIISTVYFIKVVKDIPEQQSS
jgi:O-antigen/teichoic acid export membrane protein